MRISRLKISNFRNFKTLDIALSEHVVIVGENRIGKSNLIHALRLLLDSSLPDSARELRDEDFWDGLDRPLAGEEIRISVEISDFEEQVGLLAVLADHLVETEPMVARVTYVYRQVPEDEDGNSNENNYEFFVFGGENENNLVGYELRRRLSMDVFSALRDAEGDLANWRRSPLRPLLEKAARSVDRTTLNEIAESVYEASREIVEIPEIQALNVSVTERIEKMVGSSHSVDITLGLSPTDPDRLIRALRLFIDEGKRGVGEASLGSANLIYLALKSLEIQQLVDEGNRDHTLLAIEEPEAHLHPHLQRLVYRDFLQPRNVPTEPPSDEEEETVKSIFLTTHSPHIVSVTPLRSLVLLQHAKDGLSTEGASTAELDLDDRDVADLERYLDVTRGEILFSRSVLLVEGDAECFLIPVIAKLMGYDLDELGISICSVSGTNFAPYIKLLGGDGLQIPYAVVTDYDPDDAGGGLARNRVANLIEIITGEEPEFDDDSELFEIGESHGIFVNNYTLEVDLFEAGRHKSICNTITALSTNGAAVKRAAGWKSDPTTLDSERLLKDIEAIGKGRFAQRLATVIKGDISPQYMRDALAFLADP